MDLKASAEGGELFQHNEPCSVYQRPCQYPSDTSTTSFGIRSRKRQVLLKRSANPSDQQLIEIDNQSPHFCLCRFPSLRATPYTFGGIGELFRWRSPLLVSYRCANHRPIMIGDERERLVTASPVMTKSRSLSWGQNNHPENGLVNLPRREIRALSPAGLFGGKAIQRLAA